MNEYVLGLAGLNVKIKTRVNFPNALLGDYRTDGANADFTVEENEETFLSLLRENPTASKKYLTWLSLYKEIAERLPAYSRIVAHGAAIAYKGNAYLFTAPSGTGKSTHAALWEKYLGATIINGDKPILDLSGEEAFVCGTPWAGKEGLNENAILPLKGICLLKRGKNAIKRIDPAEYYNEILTSLYRSKDTDVFRKTVALSGKLMKKVPFYVLYCDVSEEAVKTAFEALEGKRYEGAVKR